ncbi:MAG: hypothetical protein M5R38_12160 [Candidatus Methylomirabilis sp.]|nr:hypothetical protein [Candidatus Methylomirabilis sp.]
MAIAEQFMDLYYKQGNVDEAKKLANAEMVEKIQATAAAATEPAGEQGDLVSFEGEEPRGQAFIRPVSNDDQEEGG